MSRVPPERFLIRRATQQRARRRCRHGRPVGWVENALDLLHASTGLPWVGTIVLATVAVRLALLPLVFRTMRNSTIIHNIRPEMEVR